MKQYLAAITLAFATFFIFMMQPGFTQTTSESLSKSLLIESTRWAAVGSSKDPEDIRIYLGQYPDGIYTTDARRVLEKNIWEQARSEYKLSAFKKFRADFPDSVYAPKADEMIARIWRTWIIAALIISGMLVSLWYAGRSPTYFEWNKEMHIAARNNDVDLLEKLKAQGHDINIRGFNDNTPMHYAAQANAVDALKWLKSQGADPDVWNYDCRTPLDLAKLNNCKSADILSACQHTVPDWHWSWSSRIIRFFRRLTRVDAI